MKIEAHNLYFVSWGKNFSELHVLEVTEDAVRATLVENGSSEGAWYFKSDLAARAIIHLGPSALRK